MPSISPAIKHIKRTLGSDKILSSSEAKAAYRSDATRNIGIPACILFPETVEDVVRIVRICSEYGISLVPRGAGTGMSGGAVPCDNCASVSFVRMKKILNLDIENQVAIVEPGVVTAKLQEAASVAGLFYPPDPSSYKISTIGGNIAENAGGLRCVKYGVTSDYVLGLEFVDSFAEIIRTGIFRDKSNSGIDLTQILCGSEGTLGIVVKAAMRLIPAPQAHITMLAEFPSAMAAADAVTELLNRGLIPCLLEFIDSQTLAAITKFINLDLVEGCGAVLLVEFDEGEERNRLLAQASEEIFSKFELLKIRKAEDSEERERLWSLRRSISPSLTRLASGKISEDVAVPRGRLAELVDFARNLSQDIGVMIPVYGHAGDGNLHVNMIFDRNDEGQTAGALKGVEAILKKTVALGGTISGEHGIGLAKKDYLSLQFDRDKIELHRKLKRVFDPKGIFNPGKLLPEA